MPSVEYVIHRISYNSYCFVFSDWVALLTLCLAPLIAHIAAGVPPASILSKTRPQWHDKICHFNPTSILWRYVAIADRRIRAKKWDTADMAATNGLFWTSEGWDGSEEMAAIVKPYSVRLPEHARLELFSSTAITTMIVTLQGASALYSLIGTLNGSLETWTNLSVDTIFAPIAIFGLLRLVAALWISEDFAYSLHHEHEMELLSPVPEYQGRPSEAGGNSDVLLQRPVASAPRFRPPTYWLSIVFRVFFLLVLLTFWFLVLAFLAPLDGGDYLEFTTTSFVGDIFYISFLTMTIVVFAYYFVRGSTDTVIPCHSSMWYKLYTFVIIAGGIVLIIIASIETHKNEDGIYTSAAPTANEKKCIFN